MNNPKEFICLVRGHQVVAEVKYKQKSRRSYRQHRCVHCNEKLMPVGKGGWITTWQWAFNKLNGSS